MTPKTPLKTSRRSRATAKLSSWLKAVCIPHQPERSGSLRVQSKAGEMVTVTVTEGAPVAPGALPVDLEDFWSRDMGVASEAFHKVTQALGYGTPQPVPNRARPVDAELTHHDYWMRHTEVAVVPNPDPEVFKRYKPIIDSHIRRFCSNGKNKHLLWEIGYDEDDIRSVAMMWIVSYEGLYKILLSTDHDNEKVLQSHLEQRFAELHGRMNLMNRDAGFDPLPPDPLRGDKHGDRDDSRTAHCVGLRVLDPVYMSDTEAVAPDSMAGTDLAEDSQLAVLEEADGFRERKKMSNGLLRTALKKMPKSIAVQKLEDIATRPGVEADVAAKAVELLERMTKSRKQVRGDETEA